jgi:hypothetical protein
MAEPGVLPLIPSVKPPSSKVGLLSTFLKWKYMTCGSAFRDYGRGSSRCLRAAFPNCCWDLGAPAQVTALHLSGQWGCVQGIGCNNFSPKWLGCYGRRVAASVVMTIVDDVALAFSLVSLGVVFIKFRRRYKRNRDV